MNDLALVLKGCTVAAERLTHASLTPSQQPIVRHVQQLVAVLVNATDGLPEGDIAMQVALPVLGESFSQQVATLQHYTRLLLESPESFGGATLPTEVQPDAQRLYQAARALTEWMEQIRTQTFEQRANARRQTPAPLDLASFLAERVPIYRWLLRHHSSQVVYRPSSEPMTVYARHYHVAELLRHIVVTLGSEIVEYGTVTLHLAQEPACVAVHITCTGTQLTRADLQALFAANGRHLYREQLDTDAGYLTFRRQTGVSSTIIVHLPRFGSETL